MGDESQIRVYQLEVIVGSCPYIDFHLNIRRIAYCGNGCGQNLFGRHSFREQQQNQHGRNRTQTDTTPKPSFCGRAAVTSVNRFADSCIKRAGSFYVTARLEQFLYILVFVHDYDILFVEYD